jgi:hypothetical protein
MNIIRNCLGTVTDGREFINELFVRTLQRHFMPLFVTLSPIDLSYFYANQREVIHKSSLLSS